MAADITADKEHKDFFDSKVLGHPAGLFVLFFTEMWERFSFYGMRVLLVNFLTMAVIGVNPGWGWASENAGALYGTYAGLLYLTPILGGYLADRKIGYRAAVIVGCIVMTLGHVSMALETEASLYIGLGLLVAGTGFFKPNITSILSEMYAYLPEKKDAAYTIFYMGVNSGAFFGMMLCGYLGEKIGWSWGFGLAGFFMLFGTLQFAFSKKLFGKIGGKPEKDTEDTETELVTGEDGVEHRTTRKKNRFTVVDKLLIVVTSIIGLFYLLDDPLAKIKDIHILPKEFIFSADTLSGPLTIVIIGVLLFLYLIISRIIRYDKIVRDRMLAVVIFAFFTLLFFTSFEQAATSMIIFARDYTQRVLTGNAALAYNIINTLLTIIPLMIVTWVLYLLNKKTFKKIPGSNIVLAICFASMWGLAIWMLAKDYSVTSYEVAYQAVQTETIEDGEKVINYEAITPARPLLANEVAVMDTLQISTSKELAVGDQVAAHLELDKFRFLDEDSETQLATDYADNKQESQIIHGSVSKIKDSEVEITVSWFSILNSFFIIAFASIFSKWWESKYNPSAAMKYGFGFIIMGIGFAILAVGASYIPQGTPAGVIRVGMVWLILFYLFNTLGELCLSPVGLSYISKLVPPKMIALMFGMWYLAIAIGNKAAASLGGMVDTISETYGLATFFWIFTAVIMASGILVMLLNPLLKKLMHGVK